MRRGFKMGWELRVSGYGYYREWRGNQKGYVLCYSLLHGLLYMYAEPLSRL
jgi:hypothetical protein